MLKNRKRAITLEILHTKLEFLVFWSYETILYRENGYEKILIFSILFLPSAFLYLYTNTPISGENFSPRAHPRLAF